MNCTLSCAASCFSVSARAVGPGHLAVAPDVEREGDEALLRLRRRSRAWRKFTSISRLQYGQPSWPKYSMTRLPSFAASATSSRRRAATRRTRRAAPAPARHGRQRAAAAREATACRQYSQPMLRLLLLLRRAPRTRAHGCSRCSASRSAWRSATACTSSTAPRSSELAAAVRALAGEADLEVRGGRGGFPEALYPRDRAARRAWRVASPALELDAGIAGTERTHPRGRRRHPARRAAAAAARRGTASSCSRPTA